ncbi:MAG TPA: mobile mystery protein B [Candidatus Babeliales bacterium]|nr:mobile mystery protein B [Candidatus Babeliales bacterium]
MKFSYPVGATPLDADELAGLIPKHITLQAQLNAWEEQNILAAQQWAFKQRDGLLTVNFIIKLHQRMFDHTWLWAGKLRQTEKNIGIQWFLIPTELKKLCDDVNYQLSVGTFSPDEIAVRLHYRLVWIHPFTNGNGRHARLMADLLITKLGRPRFSWGMQQVSDLYQATPVRQQYIAALQAADQGDYAKLIAFARS